MADLIDVQGWAEGATSCFSLFVRQFARRDVLRRASDRPPLVRDVHAGSLLLVTMEGIVLVLTKFGLQP